ncbi:MAG TPA: hypothetical protein PLL30_06665 [Candidatus Krumholzibacteria bacterium]|nr:hypothetical protein [Candidatus Krumholzibacteria bacterium]HPD71444.1 hypothetical protein [Candidatus Krumholzibacteria bacterium]HRY41623.1 hypothetical protein [Candidatus Krumholzibacteria bacterium]
MRSHRFVPVIVLGALLTAGAAPAAAGQSGWLLRQADLEVARLTGDLPADGRDWQTDLGGSSRPAETGTRRSSAVVPMLMSLAVPGAGELYLGHKRGYLQIALDAASWYLAFDAADKGDQKESEYYAYADAHWFEEKLDAAYDAAYLQRPDANFDYSQVVGVGTEYFDYNIYDNPDTGLPLWVSRDADRREYYENLGKWDQFVFGWDDFTDPRVFLGLDPDDIDTANLDDPRTSAHRETYRAMRKESNDYYNKRDRYIYLSIAFRVFSVVQVAYLEGLLFGGGSNGGESSKLEIGGHQVDVFVEPIGYTRGVIGATVSF